MTDLPKTDNVEVAIVYAALELIKGAHGSNDKSLVEARAEHFKTAYQAIAEAVNSARPAGPQPGTKKPL